MSLEATAYSAVPQAGRSTKGRNDESNSKVLTMRCRDHEPQLLLGSKAMAVGDSHSCPLPAANVLEISNGRRPGLRSASIYRNGLIACLLFMLTSVSLPSEAVNTDIAEFSGLYSGNYTGECNSDGHRASGPGKVDMEIRLDGTVHLTWHETGQKQKKVNGKSRIVGNTVISRFPIEQPSDGICRWVPGYNEYSFTFSGDKKSVSFKSNVTTMKCSYQGIRSTTTCKSSGRLRQVRSYAQDTTRGLSVQATFGSKKKEDEAQFDKGDDVWVFCGEMKWTRRNYAGGKRWEDDFKYDMTMTLKREGGSTLELRATGKSRIGTAMDQPKAEIMEFNPERYTFKGRIWDNEHWLPVEGMIDPNAGRADGRGTSKMFRSPDRSQGFDYYVQFSVPLCDSYAIKPSAPDLSRIDGEGQKELESLGEVLEDTNCRG